MKKILLSCLTFISITSNAQEWNPLNKSETIQKTPDFLSDYHDICKGYSTDYNSIKNQLLAIPKGYSNALIVRFPNVDGEIMSYKVWETPIMHPELAKKYPGIKTYTGELMGNKNVTAKIDVTYDGIHFMNYGLPHTTVITSSRIDPDVFLTYTKELAPNYNPSPCEYDDELHNLVPNETQISIDNNLQQRVNGATRKTYSIALACTYEYAVAVTGSSTPTMTTTLSAMATTLNRVNGVYEREFSVTMELVANNDTLVYLTSADPYTNNNGSTMLSENITTCNNRIGSANYDIGHVFSTGGGGVAYLNSLCNNTYKAGGVTGLSNPVGDLFAIDYVAHEIGHQFGGPHTFNANTGSCNGNGSSNSAFEPGSGSTIMAYAGICGTTNDLQSNSDPYFHSASLRNITNHLNGTGGTCATLETSTNTANAIATFASDNYNIPTNTPFELTAPAITDVTVDTLLYSWEEWDLGGFGLDWNATNNTMPFFRSFTPSTSPVRVFPKMNSILANNLYTKGERIPTAARTMKFVLTVRDIYEGWGALNSTFDIDTVIVNAVGTTDTFKVTSQAVPESWEEGNTKTITWNVAATNASPFNVSNVKIYLSTDSAKTFPILLGTFPNIGSATITVPGSINTNNARIKVKGENNVFFQVNRANIAIASSPLSLDGINLEVIPDDQCNNQIKWEIIDKEQAINSFDIWKSNDGINYKIINTTLYKNDVNEYIFIDSDKNSFVNNYYKLSVNNLEGLANFSDVRRVVNNCNFNSYSIYPNPMGQHNNLTIIAQNNIEKVEINNALGQQILSVDNVNSKQTTINTSLLASGIYFIKVKSNGEWLISKKIIK